MVDVDRRVAGLTLAHAAGLRRLYARADSASRTTLSLRSLAENFITCLRGSGTHLHPSITDEEFAIFEAEFGLVFPPDLRAVLSSGLPTGPAFPDWRCSPGAVQCGNDLSDLFVSSQIREESYQLLNPSGYTRKSLDSSGRHPRWIEFWSDTADEQRRKSFSSSSPERFFEMLPAQSTKHWVDAYIEGIVSILKDGGWSEQDVREMTVVPASDFFREGGRAALDRQVVLDMLLLKVDRFAEMMRNTGWSADDVLNALEPGLQRTSRGR